MSNKRLSSKPSLLYVLLFFKIKSVLINSRALLKAWTVLLCCLMFPALQFHSCFPQFLWCIFAGHPLCDVSQICVHSCLEQRDHYTPSPWHEILDHSSPAWTFVPVAACCPAQTLSSDQTRLHWWTEAGLFISHFGGDLLSGRRRDFGEEMQHFGIWGNKTKTPFKVSVNLKVAVGRWPANQRRHPMDQNSATDCTCLIIL